MEKFTRELYPSLSHVFIMYLQLSNDTRTWTLRGISILHCFWWPKLSKPILNFLNYFFFHIVTENLFSFFLQHISSIFSESVLIYGWLWWFLALYVQSSKFSCVQIFNLIKNKLIFCLLFAEKLQLWNHY